MTDLIIIGAGGHGKVVADVASAMNMWKNISFLDEKYPDLREVSGFKVVGSDSMLKEMNKDDVSIIVAIGDNKKRLEYIEKLQDDGYQLPVIKHPSAVISDSVKIGSGTVVFPNVVINVDSTIGTGCILNTAATIDHDCVVGDGVHISPGANLGGSVRLGRNTWIGIGSAIRNDINIGNGVKVGAGSVVVSDIGNNVVSYGVPAKVVQSNK